MLIDEKKGRQKAQILGLRILGTLGILVKAKEQKLIPSLNAEVKNLSDAGFYLSQELIKKLLDQHEPGS